MNNIGFYNETDNEIKEENNLVDLINYALSYEKVENAELNIIIIDNKKIQEINKQYRGKDKPTDVISFALEDDDVFVQLETKILGDIYISYDKIVEQSKDYGHSFLREFAFLTVHGVLHLLGYDHLSEDEEKIMFERQEKILNGYGIKR